MPTKKRIERTAKINSREIQFSDLFFRPLKLVPAKISSMKLKLQHQPHSHNWIDDGFNRKYSRSLMCVRTVAYHGWATLSSRLFRIVNLRNLSCPKRVNFARFYEIFYLTAGAPSNDNFRLIKKYVFSYTWEWIKTFPFSRNAPMPFHSLRSNNHITTSHGQIILYQKMLLTLTKFL